jgi:sarcosine oxidase subunit beta
VSTDTAVIAAGPFSGNVSALAGLELPVEVVLRQKLVVPDEPLVPPDAPMTIDDDTGAHWRPALRGAYVLFTDPRTPSGPPVEDITPEHRFAFQLLDPMSEVSVARTVPFWREVWERGATNWIVQGGQYTMTPDHRPLIGPTPIEGLCVNTGYSGHGIMAGPAGSRILVDLLVARMHAESNPFRLDRIFVHRELDVL